NISYSVSRMCLGDTFVKSLFGDIHQLLSQNAAAADGNSASGIAHKRVVNHSYIEAYNIAKGKVSGTSQTMHNLIVDRNTGETRELLIAAARASRVNIA